jgi:hypothetical protein
MWEDITEKGYGNRTVRWEACIYIWYFFTHDVTSESNALPRRAIVCMVYAATDPITEHLALLITR